MLFDLLRIGKGKEQEEEDYDPLYPNKTTPSASEKGYEQQYRSNSAAPKQIIVQIENMMNVESVDLSNPENKAAVENVKQQLAQALIDVVHDFDVSFHS